MLTECVQKLQRGDFVKTTKSKTIYAFVGVPKFGMMYSQTIENADDRNHVEEEIDSMFDFVDCQRGHRPVWATYEASKVSFADACADFGRYMARRKEIG